MRYSGNDVLGTVYRNIYKLSRNCFHKQEIFYFLTKSEIVEPIKIILYRASIFYRFCNFLGDGNRI